MLDSAQEREKNIIMREMLDVLMNPCTTLLATPVPGITIHVSRGISFFFAVRLCSPALSICRRDDINNILDMKGSCIKFNPARAAEKRSAVKF